MKTNERKPSIQMIARNPVSKALEVVLPESEVALVEMMPMFWCKALAKYVSIPGVGASDVVEEWRVQRSH